MKKLRNVALLLLMFLGATPALAQVQSPDWSEPYRLSNETGNVMVGGAMMTGDQYGYTHTIWGEMSYVDGRTTLLYSQFDGESWTPAVDFHIVAGTTFGFIGPPVVDKNGILHLVWTGSTTGPIFYMQAVASEAGSAKAWSMRSVIRVPASYAEVQVDAEGVVHIIYANEGGQETGVYYIRSADEGETWTQPYWLDPDIPVNYIAGRAYFRIDSVTQDLHVVWPYEQVVDDAFQVVEVRYSHSTDGGDTWSLPYLVDAADESPDELRSAGSMGLSFAVYNQELHIIWAGTATVNREHRHSTDNGETWSNSRRIFGSLQGAAGDSLFVDGSGRFHYLGQIRWPQGIYHSIWNGEAWREPQLVYLVRKSSYEDYRGVHAHFVRAAIQNGNQLIITFTNSPGELDLVLYTIHTTLQDIPAVAPLPLPTEPAPVVMEAETAANAAVVATPRAIPQFETEITDISAPTTSLWVSMLPTAAILLLVIAVGVFKQRHA